MPRLLASPGMLHLGPFEATIAQGVILLRLAGLVDRVESGQEPLHLGATNVSEVLLEESLASRRAGLVLVNARRVILVVGVHPFEGGGGEKSEDLLSSDDKQLGMLLAGRTIDHGLEVIDVREVLQTRGREQVLSTVLSVEAVLAHKVEDLTSVRRARPFDRVVEVNVVPGLELGRVMVLEDSHSLIPNGIHVVRGGEGDDGEGNIEPLLKTGWKVSGKRGQ